VGCGEGGPGQWVARETGTATVGVDFSPVATAHAEQLAYAQGLGVRARYVAADASATGLKAGSLDGAMSIDVLQLLPDRAAVVAEVARVLRTGTQFAFTTWDAARMPPGRVPLADHRPLLESAGFTVVVYEETPHWRRHMQAAADDVVAHLPALRAELGDELADALAQDNTALLSYPDHMRRILGVARRG
jgi:SAM-dependent methyltransferase